MACSAACPFRGARISDRGHRVRRVVGEHYNWTVMLVLVIMLGVDHPPTRDDTWRWDASRQILGLVSLAIPDAFASRQCCCSVSRRRPIVRRALGHRQPLGDRRMAVEQEHFEPMRIGIVLVQLGQLAKRREIRLRRPVRCKRVAVALPLETPADGVLQRLQQHARRPSG